MWRPCLHRRFDSKPVDLGNLTKLWAELCCTATLGERLSCSSVWISISTGEAYGTTSSHSVELDVAPSIPSFDSSRVRGSGPDDETELAVIYKRVLWIFARKPIALLHDDWDSISTTFHHVGPVYRRCRRHPATCKTLRS